MLRFLKFLLFIVILAWAAKPMEPLTNYNVIMVHGAADSKGGIEKGEVRDSICGIPAYDKYGRVFGSADMMGKKGYKNHEDENDYNLTYWLDSAVFENVEIDNYGNRKYLSVRKRDDEKDIKANFSSIYFQRPFLDPAKSPRHNARELGDGTWKSPDECSERRSLIEEAQEVRAEGRFNLKTYRGDAKYRDKLPPSRNILIGHSMGGVISREYVQSKSLYHDDVDKVIALDSLHEGTEHPC